MHAATTVTPSPFSRIPCSQERTLEALTAVLEVLESAQLERDENGRDRVLGDRVVLGLLVAARQLTGALYAAAPVGQESAAAAR